MKRRPEYTPEEGRELTRRLERTLITGGVPHAVVRQEMLDDMERELRQMVRNYRGTARQAKQILEGLVIAREAGVTACDEIERLLAERLRKPRRAA
jgi:hypothetical protein